jgi:hypothetical protein
MQAKTASIAETEPKHTSDAILLNSDYSFGQNELFSSDVYTTFQKDSLKSLEALCLFGYQEFVTNLLSILMKVTRIIFGENVPVHTSTMDMFNLSNPGILLHMRNRMSFEEQEYPLTYRVPKYNETAYRVPDLTFHCSVTRPVQFPLGNLPSATNFTDKHGKNWTERNIKQYFPPKMEVPDPSDPESSDIEDEGEKKGKGKTTGKKRGKAKKKSAPVQPKKNNKTGVMTTAKHYEANHILLWTMQKIQRLKTNDQGEGPYLFEIQCDMASYSFGDERIRARHPHLFKGRHHFFCPINDLILSMPFDFINKLKNGEWTRIDPNWLKKLRDHLANADKNSIKQVRFIRKIYTMRWHKSPEYENEDDRLIFLVHTADGKKYYVNNTMLLISLVMRIG